MTDQLTHSERIDYIIMTIVFIMVISVTGFFFVTHAQNHAKILERIEQNKVDQPIATM